MKLFLVHGIFDDGRLFKNMSDYLITHNLKPLIPALKPADARYGINDLAKKLEAFIQENTEANETFSIVAFSMGCLITRVYLQHLGGAKRCVNFHAISGPHHGSFLAYLFVGQGAKDLRPKSLLLQKLHASQSSLSQVNLFSYRTPYDQMILPSKSSHWPIAKNIVTHAPLHRLMLRHPLVLETIKDNLVIG